MTPKQLSFNVLGLCGFVLLVGVTCVGCNDSNQVSGSLLENEISSNVLESANGNDVMYWPWPTFKFKCPSAFGVYPDPESCAHFYVCYAKIATHTRCPYFYRFCRVKRMCLPMLIAVCDDGSGEVTDEVSTQEVTTQKENQFVCPEENGQYLHPYDCTKYYNCKEFKHKLKTCPDSQLFDGLKKKCRSAEKVHCGTRVRPTDFPPLETTQEPTTSIITTHSVTDTPVTRPRVTAPDTDCDENDLDCIIDELGLTPDWFVCPDAMGSYPHPTSKKLFIFCINWKPLVKKCGHGLQFSEELMTCASV